MKKTAEEILKQHANCELKMILEDDLHWLTEAMHQYAAFWQSLPIPPQP